MHWQPALKRPMSATTVGGSLGKNGPLAEILANRSPNRTLLLLVRHGETDWNLEGRLQGHTDVPLNSAGRRQAECAAEALRELGLAVCVDAVVSSDLARARETADTIAGVCGEITRQQYPGLREVGFGDIEGKLLSDPESARLRSCALNAWMAGRFDESVPNGESVSAVIFRGLLGLKEAAKLGRCVAVVAHGGVLKWCAVNIHMTKGGDPRLRNPSAGTMAEASLQNLLGTKVANCCVSLVWYDHDEDVFQPHSWFQDLVAEAKDDTG